MKGVVQEDVFVAKRFLFHACALFIMGAGQYDEIYVLDV